MQVHFLSLAGSLFGSLGRMGSVLFMVFRARPIVVSDGLLLVVVLLVVPIWGISRRLFN